jgi:hypothetical protein
VSKDPFKFKYPCPEHMVDYVGHPRCLHLRFERANKVW